jgi:hypothetical protein
MNDKLLAYFIKQTNRRFDQIDARFDRIDENQRQLLEFKWKSAGGLAVINVIVIVVIQILFGM